MSLILVLLPPTRLHPAPQGKLNSARAIHSQRARTDFHNVAPPRVWKGGPLPPRVLLWLPRLLLPLRFGASQKQVCCCEIRVCLLWKRETPKKRLRVRKVGVCPNQIGIAAFENELGGVWGFALVCARTVVMLPAVARASSGIGLGDSRKFQSTLRTRKLSFLFSLFRFFPGKRFPFSLLLK